VNASILPLLFLFIFGYAVSLDLDNVGLCLVVEQPTPAATSFAAALTNSRFFAVRAARDRRQCAGMHPAPRYQSEPSQSCAAPHLPPDRPLGRRPNADHG